MPWVLLGLLVGTGILAHTAPFRFLFDWLRPSRSVWRMPPHDPPRVYLTFDDGPNPAATPALLDLLYREHARATFFVIDRHVTDATAPIVRRIVDEGHALALHSHTRRLMIMSPARLAETLSLASARLEHITGRPPCGAFRPHAGWRSWMMLQGVGRGGLRLVGWGWRLWDFDWYRAPRPERVAERLARRASNGSIMVLHDGHHVNPAADRRHTIETVARLIPRLRARGFGFGTICEAEPGAELSAQCQFCSRPGAIPDNTAR
jgi:peptidoglycan/xylan/chitin deacetylase (PgdA/CDA1 family)